MIRANRPTRNRRIPQPGGIGAPFNGIYLVGIGFEDASLGVVDLIIGTLDQDGLGITGNGLLTPGQSLPTSIFQMFVNGNPVVCSSAVVGGTGNEINLSTATTGTSIGVSIAPGLRELTSLGGALCGGIWSPD